MPELCGEAIEIAPALEAPALEAPKIAVGVNGRSGFYALKWALEKEVPAHGLVYLMHVRPLIRWIPNEMGGKFPVEQVHPEKVRKFKKERFLEAEKLVDQYRMICDGKKIKSEVCYSESDSVQKELVNQISKFGITKLVLGTSQSAFSRALKVESVSTYVAKHAPGFCVVLVVNKGKLCYGNKVCSSASFNSEASVSSVSQTNMGNDEVDSRTSNDIQNGERSRWSGVTDDIITLDFSETSPEWLLSHSMSSNGAHHSHPSTVMKRIQSAPSTGRLSECSPSTPLDLPWTSLDYSPAQLNESPFKETRTIEDRFFDSFNMVHPVATNIETPEIIQSPDCDTPSQITMDIGDLGIIGIPATQRPLHAHENGRLCPNMSFANGSAVVVPEADLLQNQLNEAKLCADMAQREAEWQENNLKSAQEVVASAKRKVVEHERRRDEALREAEKAMQQATKAMAALEWAQRDRERIKQRLAEEVESHQKTQVELETQKSMVEAEISKCEETTLKLEDLTRKLEVECQLRKGAEEKASLEAVAKLDALAALRRERQRYTEYSYEELQSATNDFNEENKLGEGGYGPVHRGKLRHTSVAIKRLARERSRGREEFQREVELLSRIRHPHMLMLLGACPEKACIVYEYMANGSLEDRLNCKDRTPPLPWYARFRICFEVATALLFLHSQPQPIVHRDLKPANILLDHHFVSKIGDVGLARLVPYNLTFNGPTIYNDSVPVGTFAYIDPDYQRTGVVSCESDVYALGIVMLQLLTGKPAVGVTRLVEEAEDKGKLEEVLDKSAGEWLLEEARKLARISLQCTEFKRRDRPKLEMHILPVLESIQKVAELAAANIASVGPSSSGTRPIVPSFFFCPILQEIMEDPHMAADGFTYEHYAIKVWLQANNTSPMTNRRLDHKNLTPNHTLRSAIREWYDNGLI